MPSYLPAAASVYETLHQFVSAYKVHPILVNFTAALVPVSVGSDVLGWVFGKQSLRDTGWWTLCFAAVITPFTAIAGWLFWMKDDVGVPRHDHPQVARYFPGGAPRRPRAVAVVVLQEQPPAERLLFACRSGCRGSPRLSRTPWRGPELWLHRKML